MPIVKEGPQTNFSQVPNELLDHSNLSPLARLILIYLLSKPEDWQVKCYDIERVGSFSKDKRQAVFNELIDAGYLDRRRIQKQGKITYEYTVYWPPRSKG
jgi:hypothetical protein